MILLPPENVPAGVTHHKPNDVPFHIGKPYYARAAEPADGIVKKTPVPWKRAKTSRLVLGTTEEHRMRRTCKLAKDALDFAGSFIKVKILTLILFRRS